MSRAADGWGKSLHLAGNGKQRQRLPGPVAIQLRPTQPRYITGEQQGDSRQRSAQPARPAGQNDQRLLASLAWAGPEVRGSLPP